MPASRMASPRADLLSPSSEEDGAGAGEEKEALIGRILELQNTLHDLTQRVNSVREENSKLKSENEVRRERGRAEGKKDKDTHTHAHTHTHARARQLL